MRDIHAMDRWVGYGPHSIGDRSALWPMVVSWTFLLGGHYPFNDPLLADFEPCGKVCGYRLPHGMGRWSHFSWPYCLSSILLQEPNLKTIIFS